MYNDAGHPATRRLTITQKSWAWQDTPYNDFVIIQYLIENKSSAPIYSLSAGQFMDFDVDINSPDDNNVGTDSTKRLAYMWSNSHPQYVGVKLLDPKIAINISGLKNKNYLSPTPKHFIPDSIKYKFLKGSLQFPASDSSDNWSVIVSTGPFSLSPSADTIIAFAIIGGDDIADIHNNADRAQEKYDSLTAVEEKSIITQNTLQIYPNPFITRTVIEFSIGLQITDCRLQIYDLTGRLVKSFPITQSPNNPATKVVWEGKDNYNREVLSGIYFCQVKVGKICRTQKIILIKGK
jgi:hypothetical protein